MVFNTHFLQAAGLLLLLGALASLFTFQPALQKAFGKKAVSEPLSVLIYETEDIEESSALSLKDQASRLKGVQASIFGGRSGFDGYGSKYASVYPELKEMSPNRLVAIVDGRDVLVNNPIHSDKYLESAVKEFEAAYEELTADHPGAIVISAEAQCCVSALTHATLGDYFNIDGSRKNRACSSGEADCLWKGDDKALPWETFMKELSIKRTGAHYDDVYLNAGLIAGKAGDLLHFIEATGIGKDEDDQAVFTDFMYKNPEAIVLDYGQKMFGNNRWAHGGMDNESCMFTVPGSGEGELAIERLTHHKTFSKPLFLHSPGGFLQCHDELAASLGIKAVSTAARRRRLQQHKPGCNYDVICLGDRHGTLKLGIGIDLPDWAK